MAASISLGSSLLKASASISFSSSFGGTQVLTQKPSSVAFRQKGPLQISAVKKIQGYVVGIKAEKTAAVEVTRITPHPKYKKRIVKTKKYQVHDPENRCKVGDFVTLDKCAPVSKTKTFVVSTIRAAKVAGEKMAETIEQTAA
eukprot:jgi/Mesen1/5196/ME000258S04293